MKKQQKNLKVWELWRKKTHKWSGTHCIREREREKVNVWEQLNEREKERRWDKLNVKM